MPWHSAFAAVVIAALLCQAAPALAAGKGPLARPKVVPDLASEVPLIKPAALAPRLGESKLLVFDVRDEPEFAVSHLRGARRVAADTDQDVLLKKLASGSGRSVVFYCTAGGRSTSLAQGLYHNLIAAGFKAVHVLEGGIFAWHNENRPLYDAKGRTGFVHPYDEETRKRLARPELARYEPRK